MYVTRQDAWSEEEDNILAQTVLQFIRDGKTQLEAFKLVAEHLSRTSAACGFRWNATLRKKYQDAIMEAKDARKKRSHHHPMEDGLDKQRGSIEATIALLERLRMGYSINHQQTSYRPGKEVRYLEKENNELKQQLIRYESAWKEMEKLWRWVHENEKVK